MNRNAICYVFVVFAFSLVATRAMPSDIAFDRQVLSLADQNNKTLDRIILQKGEDKYCVSIPKHFKASFLAVTNMPIVGGEVEFMKKLEDKDKYCRYYYIDEVQPIDYIFQLMTSEMRAVVSMLRGYDKVAFVGGNWHNTNYASIEKVVLDVYRQCRDSGVLIVSASFFGVDMNIKKYGLEFNFLDDVFLADCGVK